VCLESDVCLRSDHERVKMTFAQCLPRAGTESPARGLKRDILKLGPIKVNAANRTAGNSAASFRAPQSLLCQRFNALQKNLCSHSSYRLRKARSWMRVCVVRTVAGPSASPDANPKQPRLNIAAFPYSPPRMLTSRCAASYLPFEYLGQSNASRYVPATPQGQHHQSNIPQPFAGIGPGRRASSQPAGTL
jgi:hypothetical protein